jgi:hypothetical protein
VAARGDALVARRITEICQYIGITESAVLIRGAKARLKVNRRPSNEASLRAAATVARIRVLVVDRWCSASDAVPQPRGTKHSQLKERQMADDTNNKLTPEQMAARIAELEARITKGGTLRFKVSEKGAVSVYGLGRFPVTLYLEQWENLLSHTDELRQFIEANRAHLKMKDKKPNP